MTNWIDFGLVFENLVKYWTFSYAVLAGVIVLIFVLMLLQRGFDIKFSLLFSLPILAGFVGKGWFGAFGWIENSILIIAGLFYAVAILKIFK